MYSTPLHPMPLKSPDLFHAEARSKLYMPLGLSEQLEEDRKHNTYVRELNNLDEVWAARTLLYQVCHDKYGWQFGHDDPLELQIEVHNKKKVLMDLINPLQDVSYNFHSPCGVFKKFGDAAQLLGYGFLSSADRYKIFQIEKRHKTLLPFLLNEDSRHYCREIMRVAVRPECVQLNFLPHLFLWLFNSCEANVSSVFMCTSDLFLLDFFQKINFPLVMSNVFLSPGTAPLNIYFADYQKGMVRQIIEHIKFYLSKTLQSRL